MCSDGILKKGAGFNKLSISFERFLKQNVHQTAVLQAKKVIYICVTK